MRICINIDVRRPFRSEAKMRRKASDLGIILELKYERLPQFCFICGIIGHNERFCHLHLEDNGKALENKYGVWLRAPIRGWEMALIGQRWLRDGNLNDPHFLPGDKNPTDYADMGADKGKSSDTNQQGSNPIDAGNSNGKMPCMGSDVTMQDSSATNNNNGLVGSDLQAHREQ